MLIGLRNNPTSRVISGGYGRAVGHSHGGAVAVKVVAVGIGIALCVGHGFKLTACRAIAELGSAAERVYDRRVSVKRVVLVFGSAAVCLGCRNKTVFCVIDIAYLRAVGICFFNKVSNRVVGHLNSPAETIRCSYVSVLRVILEGLGGIVAVCDLYEISVEIVIIGRSSAI